MSHKVISIRESIDVIIPTSTKVSLQESAKTEAGLPGKITTLVEAIHSGLTRNYTFYPSDNLERSVESWTRPYNKPVIKNHNIYEEPLGRVKSAAFKQSNISPDKHTIELELEITDAETIRKVMDGRYQTLSIGGNASSATCSVCGKDLVKEGYCGHQKGRTYEGKQAYWIIGEMDFDEISWVNVPADRSAQVVQKNVVRAQESAPVTDEKGGSTMTVEDTTTDILEQIDQLNGVQTQEATATAEAPEDGHAEDAVAVAESGDETPPAVNTTESEDAPEDAPEDAEAKLQEQVNALNERVQTLEAENTTLLAERDELQESVDSLNTENGQLKEKVAALEAELIVANEESAGAVKQNVLLASYTHRTLAESVANLQLVLGETSEEDYSTKLEELSKETSRSLKEKAKTLSEKKPQRIVQTVDNPLNASGEDAEFTETASQQKEEMSIVDLFEKMSLAFNKTQQN